MKNIIVNIFTFLTWGCLFVGGIVVPDLIPLPILTAPLYDPPLLELALLTFDIPVIIRIMHI